MTTQDFAKEVHAALRREKTLLPQPLVQALLLEQVWMNARNDPQWILTALVDELIATLPHFSQRDDPCYALALLMALTLDSEVLDSEVKERCDIPLHVDRFWAALAQRMNEWYRGDIVAHQARHRAHEDVRLHRNGTGMKTFEEWYQVQAESRQERHRNDPRRVRPWHWVLGWERTFTTP